ncbi:helix-turn-helix domain-containing protein [Devosia sp. WQ 349]|nr:helix-turn-helix domain-containing protein [Devosia sp. WQ 349K1]
MDQGDKKLDDLNMSHIPTYTLYGELTDPHEWLHWETIQARSRLHGFHIEKHRHEQLLQVLVIDGGAATAVLDGVQVSLQAGDLVLIPTMVVHEYWFSEEVDGLVLTLFETDIRALGFAFDQALVIRCVVDARSLVDQVIGELRSPGAKHELVQNALLTLLFAAIERASAASIQSDSPLQRNQLLFDRFRGMVEQTYRSSRSVSVLAQQLGVSHTHLNRVCHAMLRSSAQSVINRRLATEARRYLMFSDLSVKLVASELGFDDPAYFARFVTRHLGKSPLQVRADRQNIIRR